MAWSSALNDGLKKYFFLYCVSSANFLTRIHVSMCVQIRFLSLVWNAWGGGILKGVRIYLTHGFKSVIPWWVSPKVEPNARKHMVVQAVLFLKRLGSKQERGEGLGVQYSLQGHTTLKELSPTRPTHLQEQHLITPQVFYTWAFEGHLRPNPPPKCSGPNSYLISTNKTEALWASQ